jgi:hypothetical protein
MWALSVRFHPQHDIVTIPNASVLALDPSSDPAGITHKVVLDATAPIAPEVRGHYGQPVDAPAETAAWETIIKGLLKRPTTLLPPPLRCRPPAPAATPPERCVSSPRLRCPGHG